MDATYATLKEKTMIGLSPIFRRLVSSAMDAAFSMGERAALLRVYREQESKKTESTFVTSVISAQSTVVSVESPSA